MTQHKKQFLRLGAVISSAKNKRKLNPQSKSKSFRFEKNFSWDLRTYFHTKFVKMIIEKAWNFCVFADLKLADL